MALLKIYLSVTMKIWWGYILHMHLAQSLELLRNQDKRIKKTPHPGFRYSFRPGKASARHLPGPGTSH